jgi:outer membrane lipoprotein carrier protein
MRLGWIAMAAAALCVSALPLRAADTTPAELAQALQKKYDAVRDFSADFVHTYRGGVLRKELSEKGRVLVKKPGKMRWDYSAPEKKLFISDGVKVYSYVPADKQVIVSSVPHDDAAATPALFLAGKGNLVRDFTPSFGETPAGQPTGTRALKLVPKTPQPDYDWLMLLVDPATLGLRGLVTSDAQGGTSTLAFANLKENVGLSDKEFAFTMPRGVDVVTDSGGR